MIYFDNAATSFPKPESVNKTIDHVNRNLAVNAGRGGYKLAKEASKIIEEARYNMAKLFGVQMESVVFAPSATYAMNTIINGLEWTPSKTVYVTPFEHNAVMRPLQLKHEQYASQYHIMPFESKDFSLDVDELERMFARNEPDYVFINHASNVVGAISPIKIISEAARKYGAIVIVDVAQTCGILNMKEVAKYADFAVFAGHKNLQGALGVGGFINLSGKQLEVVFAGGTGSDSLNLNMAESSPIRYEIGSPNISGIAALNAGLKWLEENDRERILKHKSGLIEFAVNELKQMDNVKLFAPAKDSYGVGVISFTVEGYEAKDVGQILDDEFDIAVRTGYHCAPLIKEFLGLDDEGGTVRFSVGPFNTKEEVQVFIDAIRSL